MMTSRLNTLIVAAVMKTKHASREALIWKKKVEDKKLFDIMKELLPSFKRHKVDAVPEQARHTVSSMEQGGSVIRLFGVDLSAAKSKSGSSRASTIERTPQFNVNYNTEKGQTGDASTSAGNTYNTVRISERGIEQHKTRCLLFAMSLPELFFSVCLQCLNPGERDERYLVSSRRNFKDQWALRYTSSETPEKTMQKCGSLCGGIAWGSLDNCLAAKLEYIIASSSLQPLPDEYPIVVVDHPKFYMQDCLKCVRSIISPISEHTEDDDMRSKFVASPEVRGFENTLFGCRKFNHCSDIKVETFPLKRSLYDFQMLKPLSPKRKGSSSRKSTTPYFCMHVTARIKWSLSRCQECITKVISDDKEKMQCQETSTKSIFVFSTGLLNVEEIAIQCNESCGWVGGLSKSVCDFLRGIELPEVSSSEDQEQPVEQNFVDVIRELLTRPPRDSLWYLQFKEADEDMIEAFKELAFCIATVSNAYVVSVKSLYLIISPFDFEHVDTICNIPDIIRVTNHRHVKSDTFSQPLEFQSITSLLDFSYANVPKSLKKGRLAEANRDVSMSTSTYGQTSGGKRQFKGN